MNSSRSGERNRSFSTSTASASASWRMRGLMVSAALTKGRASAGSNTAGKDVRNHSRAAFSASTRVGPALLWVSAGFRKRTSS